MGMSAESRLTSSYVGRNKKSKWHVIFVVDDMESRLFGGHYGCNCTIVILNGLWSTLARSYLRKKPSCEGRMAMGRVQPRNGAGSCVQTPHTYTVYSPATEYRIRVTSIWIDTALRRRTARTFWSIAYAYMEIVLPNAWRDACVHMSKCCVNYICIIYKGYSNWMIIKFSLHHVVYHHRPQRVCIHIWMSFRMEIWYLRDLQFRLYWRCRFVHSLCAALANQYRRWSAQESWD